jgi:hypothetical protein
MDATTIAVVGIIATVIVALATLVVAYQTKSLAKSTADLGTQAERQVMEMETTRQLEWAPYLTFDSGQDQPAGNFVHYKATVKNIGRGPAINCLVARFLFQDKWCLSGNFELGSLQHHETLAPGQADPPPDFLGAVGAGRTVMFCQDQGGACHMFDPPRSAEISATADGEPAWANWYRKQIGLI